MIGADMNGSVLSFFVELSGQRRLAGELARHERGEVTANTLAG